MNSPAGDDAAPIASAWPTRMQPVTFDGCFGWLHSGVSSTGSDTAILLCSGLGRDASTAHRSFRMLADRLAGAGYPTLRFDYRGTGDSCDASDATCWTSWQRSLDAAADWLLARTRIRRLVLIGLRLGATLAALFASVRDDVAGLVLLEPVLRGRSYVAQLTIEARVRGMTAAAPSEGLALEELLLDHETLTLLSQTDLRHLSLRPRCAVSVFSRSPNPVLSACEQAWSASGAAVTLNGFLGLEALLRPSHLAADEAHADFTSVLSWLQAAVPSRRSNRPSAPSLRGSAALKPAGCIETPHRFGEHDHLFGMLCRPEAGGLHGFALIICNTGGDPHHGFARFSVEFARRLANEGITSLRLDFAGLGDSANPSGTGGEDVTHILAADRSPDIGAAIEMLRGFGYRTFGLGGLCSGAYHAFNGALSDERIEVLLLINLPFFSLRFDKPGAASFARRSMVELSRRQATTLLLYAAGDPGVKILEQHFGPGGAALLETPGAIASIEAGFDHDLTGGAMRRYAADRMIAFLRQTPSLGVPRAIFKTTDRFCQYVAPRHGEKASAAVSRTSVF